ncbi:hypothetical protein TsocGM_05410 [Tautonia sociabilis]|uniref:AsmA-like C-terminal domain-containing protein n=1 Tax=Tautonia sociabilis TaxID=2080755 RepID=A0A432MNX1_9BACT|nr:hypothetical protein TsocGM_05410 [Tautonia sociabilis]
MAAAIAAVGLLVAFLPALIGLGPVRQAIVAQVNRMYAPTTIELSGVAASWTGPVLLEGVVLRDGNGKAVVSSPSATLDRSLWDLITRRPDYGTLTLHKATVDIERRADGSIDLAEALAPILEGDDEQDDGGPETRFTLAIEAGSLSLSSPELARPISADRLEMTLHCVPAPLRWEIALANPGGQTLDVSGHYDSTAPEATEVVVSIAGSGWPLAVEQAGVIAEGVFGGEVAVRMVGESVALAGEAVLTEVSAGGPTLKGDRPAFDRVEASWDVELAGDGIAVRRLALEAPVASVGQAPDSGEGQARWRARIDLAGLARQLPNTIALREGMTLERGSADVDAIVGPTEEDGASPVVVTARLADLVARNGGRVVAMAAPVTLSARIRQREGSVVAVESAELSSSFLKAEGSGDLDRGVTLNGMLDLAALDRQLRDWVDLGEVALAGSARFGGDFKRDGENAAFTTRLAIEAQGLRIAGLTSEPISQDSARFDLIVQGPATPAGLPGGWSRVHVAARSEGLDAVVDVAPDADAFALDGRITLPRTAPGPDEPAVAPVRLAFDATYRPANDRLDLAALEVAHELGRLRGSGTIEGLSSSRVADLSGTVEPDWEQIRALIAQSTEPQATISGNPSPFRLAGPLSGDSTAAILSGIDAELGVDVTGAVVFGMSLGPAPVVVRCVKGDLQISPIDSTLNGGRVVLRPDVLLGEDGAMTLTLADGSGLDQVEITDDVSRRVLAYIAPVLREATEVNGRLSARISRLIVPIVGPASERDGGAPIDLAARVAFHQVTYGPGPMMQNILGLMGMAPRQVPKLTIDQVVDVAIADGRVYQSGLEITAAEGVALQLEGSVGLDQTLALRVGVPLSDRMLGGQEILSGVLSGTRVGLPIGGTLSRPQLDRESFRIGLRQQGGRLLSRGAAVGAGQLLRMLDDDPPPASEAGASGTDGPPPVAPSAEETLRDLGRGLLRDVIGGAGGQP